MTSSTETLSPVTAIRFDSYTCDRCGGSGQMPFAAYDGVCFGCNGKGEKTTRKGAAAFKAVQAWKAAHLTVAASSLQTGDRIMLSGRRATVVTVTTTLGQGNGTSSQGTRGTDTFAEWMTYGQTVVVTQKASLSGPAHMAIEKLWTREQLAQCAAELAHFSGLIVVRAEA